MKMMVYNMKMCPKIGHNKKKNREIENLRNTTLEGKTLDTRLYYFGQAEDDFYILFI